MTSGEELWHTELGRRAFLASLLAVLAAACGSSNDDVAAEVTPTPQPSPAGSTATPETTAEATAAPSTPTAEPTSTPDPGDTPAPFEGYPFTLGVASGDPTSASVILWTRLAPDPHNPDDPRNGMPDADVDVKWEVGIFPDGVAGEVVASGVAVASAASGHSVHIDATGLTADTWFSYRFIVGEHRSPVGRTRTLPADDASTPMTFAFSSCQQREVGYYAAHRSLADAGEDIDLFFWLGDYIYEYGPSASPPIPDRAHDSPEVTDLAGYRNRYAQYRSDPDLQAHHGTRPVGHHVGRP